MKYIITFSIGLVYSMLAFGQTLNLTDFTKSVIKEYVLQNVEKGSPDNMIMYCTADSCHYFVDIFEDAEEYYDTTGMSTVNFDDIDLKVSGIELPFLFTGTINAKELKANKKYEGYIYDPLIWQIAFHKDGTLCKMFTYNGTMDSPSIDNIISLAERYLGGVSLTEYDEKYIYSNVLVDTPAVFQQDEDLQKILSSNINVSKKILNHSIPVIINLIIDKTGKAKVDGFFKKYEDEDINAAALYAAEAVCKYDFTPAKHRGEIVCVNYALFFPKSMFLH